MRRLVFGSAALSFLAFSFACTEHVVVTEAPAAPVEEVDAEAPPPDAAPVEKGPVEVDLGEVTTGTDVTFDVPEGTLGFHILADGSAADFDPNRPYGIERIVDPKGKIVHDDFTPIGGTNPTSIAQFDTLLAASVPQSEAASEPLVAGKWKVRFGVFGNAAAKTKLSAKIRFQATADGVFHGGSLALHLHVPSNLRIGNATVDASKAAQNAALKERIDLFFELTESLLGIVRSDVVFHQESQTYAELDDDEVVRGFAVSDSTDDGKPALHVLLTNAIRQGGEEIALGIAPGIPGAANVYGRNVSGIIVVTSGSAETDVLTMIHEAGHFIGLNHTTEFDGRSSDPLADTPKCSNIANGQLMSCPDRTNVMFAAGAIDGPASLSPTQRRVYHGSPIYRALTSSSASRTVQARADSTTSRPIARHFTRSGRALSAIEGELALGFCGLSAIDPARLVERHGRTAVVARLRIAAQDPDLAPFLRGRAKRALDALLGQR